MNARLNTHTSGSEVRRYPPKPNQVYYFGTCLIDLFYPEAGLHGIQLLEREGVQVIYPERQSCCGQPAFNSGYDKESQTVAAAQIDAFPENLPIVVPSASCAGMIRRHYPELFKATPLESAAAEFAARTFELTEFLVHVCKVQLQDKGQPVKVVAHHSCSAQRHAKVADCGNQLIGQLRNVSHMTQERGHECCGFGGTFAVKSPAISNAMVQDKCDSLVNTRAELLVTGDCGCMMNISGALEKRKDKLPAKHLATFLWERTQ